MKNPWQEICLEDYEKHMSLKSVYQLQALSEIMGKQFAAYEVNSVMVLGVAGGNGLEHIKGGKFSKIYGVDVNQDYLDTCKKRYANLGDRLETIRADLTVGKLQLPHAKLLIADLLIEYIGYDAFAQVVRSVRPGFVSCVIQVNEGEDFVSDSPYLHCFDRLEEVHCQMEEERLTECMQQIFYQKKLVEETPLPNGKKLLRIDYERKLLIA